MKDRTLCFLMRGNPPSEVLLGFKKTGFGAGKYTGVGGKVEAGESMSAPDPYSRQSGASVPGNTTTDSSY